MGPFLMDKNRVFVVLYADVADDYRAGRKDLRKLKLLFLKGSRGKPAA